MKPPGQQTLSARPHSARAISTAPRADLRSAPIASEIAPEKKSPASHKLVPLDKQKFPAAAALAVAETIRDLLAPSCEKIEIAGSLRRRKPFVGDIELLYIPKTKKLYDLLGDCEREVPLTDIRIAELVGFAPFAGRPFLTRRKNIKGAETFGDRIKLMRHTESGIPVDLFSTTAESWWNYLVCRTGGAQSNTRIAGFAKARGYKWEPYSPGFVDLHDGRTFKMDSEEAVFKFVGLPYEQPWQRP